MTNAQLTEQIKLLFVRAQENHDTALMDILLTFSENQAQVPTLRQLQSDLKNYQLSHHFQGTPGVAKLQLALQQTGQLREGVGTAAFLSNIWFP